MGGRAVTAPASLAEALALLQGQLPRVAKTADAQYGKYADLTVVSEAILPLMSALGLAFTAMPTVTQDGRFVLHYRLLHVSGDDASGDYPLPTSGSPQQIGAAITYARRYSLCAVTGLAPGGDDDDAASAEKTHHEAQKRPRNVPDAQLEEEGRMTRAQAAEHDNRRASTLRDAAGKKAERTRPRHPDPDDPWARDEPVTGQRAGELREAVNGADPEDKPGSVMPAQHRAIEMLLGRLGIPREARADRHEYVRALFALDALESLNDLTYTQAADAIRILSDEAAKEKSR